MVDEADRLIMQVNLSACRRAATRPRAEADRPMRRVLAGNPSKDFQPLVRAPRSQRRNLAVAEGVCNECAVGVHFNLALGRGQQIGWGQIPERLPDRNEVERRMTYVPRRFDVGQPAVS